MYTFNDKSISNTLKNLIKKIKLVVFDFDGVFTNNMVHILPDGSESVRCYRGDGIGIEKINKLGIKSIIISSEPNQIVLVRSKKLGITCIHGCEDKQYSLEKVIKEMKISIDQVAFVGNDINDLTCLKIVGLPIVVHDAHPDVISHCKYQTKTKGGYGAVREVCDLLAYTLQQGEVYDIK